MQFRQHQPTRQLLTRLTVEALGAKPLVVIPRKSAQPPALVKEQLPLALNRAVAAASSTWIG